MIILHIFIFCFGLVVGSFLNCVIYRLEKNESFFGGRSYCPNCKHKLSWQDLIPILSFIELKGKCRYCKQKISWQYPIVETVTALLFLLIFNSQFLWIEQSSRLPVGLLSKQFPISNFYFLFSIFYFLISACFLIIIFVYDLRHYIIPDEIIFPAIALPILYRVFEVLKFDHWNLFKNLKLEIGNFQPLLNPFLSAILASAFFLVIFLISRGKWLGFGDVKLALFMGLFLGFPNILVALFLAFFIGAIIGLGLILGKKKTLKSEVPFGPFLVAGIFIAFFWGNNLINWYLNLFLL
jgi:prepilin signal peptidase PulO-like enzyme (type II secretory pathway)